MTLFRMPVGKAGNESLNELLGKLVEAQQGLRAADDAVRNLARNVNTRYPMEMARMGIDPYTERFHDEWAGYASDFFAGRAAAAVAIQQLMELLTKSR